MKTRVVKQLIYLSDGTACYAEGVVTLLPVGGGELFGVSRWVACADYPDMLGIVHVPSGVMVYPLYLDAGPVEATAAARRLLSAAPWSAWQQTTPEGLERALGEKGRRKISRLIEAPRAVGDN